jgi:hypothetical protein
MSGLLRRSKPGGAMRQTGRRTLYEDLDRDSGFKHGYLGRATRLNNRGRHADLPPAWRNNL